MRDTPLQTSPRLPPALVAQDKTMAPLVIEEGGEEGGRDYPAVEVEGWRKGAGWVELPDHSQHIEYCVVKCIFSFNIHHREICQVVTLSPFSHEKTGSGNLGPLSKILPLVNEEMEIRTQSRATAAPPGGQWRNWAQLLTPQ